MKHIAIYLRVSTDDKGQDTAMQLREIETYLNAKGLSNFKIYEDKGFRGAVADRPALKEMLADCRSGRVSKVVCYKMDRLFRSLKHLINILSEFETLAIEFIAVKDAIDMTTATGRLMMQIIGAFSEFEASVIKERVISGLSNAKANGIKLGRPMSRVNNRVKDLTDEGMSASEISKKLNVPVRTVYNAIKRLSI